MQRKGVSDDVRGMQETRGHCMRTKYLDVSRDNMIYVKQRRHTQKRTRKMIRRLQDLLGKILVEVRRLDRENPCLGLFSESQLSEIETITKIYRQQCNHHESGNTKESIPNRIVSFNKSYVCPIVRGKEIKSGVWSQMQQHPG